MRGGCKKIWLHFTNIWHILVKLGGYLALRLKEHKSKVEKASAKAFTRSQASVTGEPNKSAITDHVVNTNHVIGWEEATIKDREQDRVKRQIRESIWIRKQGQHSMNRDGGNYILPNIYDQLLDEKIAIYRQVQTDWPEVGSFSLKKCYVVTWNCSWGMFTIGFVIMNFQFNTQIWFEVQFPLKALLNCPNKMRMYPLLCLMYYTKYNDTICRKQYLNTSCIHYNPYYEFKFRYFIVIFWAEGKSPPTNKTSYV